MSTNSSPWDDAQFQVRKDAERPDDDQPDPRLEPVWHARNRKPTPEATTVSGSDLLMQAISLAGARRGRITRAQSVREQTLLEVLQQAMRRAR